MEGKIDVRIMQGGKLLKELSEENVIILTERQCGELFSHIGIEEAAILAAQISIDRTCANERRNSNSAR